MAPIGRRRSKEGQEEGSKVHDLEQYLVQERLLHALPEVCQRGGGQLCFDGDPRRNLQRSCKPEIPDQQSYPNGLLLAYPAEGRKGVRQEM